MGDRTVHAVTASGSLVVRYEKAGTWSLETGECSFHGRIIGVGRRRIPLRKAVALATAPGSKVYLGLPGGLQFDARVRRERLKP